MIFVLGVKMDYGFRIQDLFQDEISQWKEASRELSERQMHTQELLSLQEKASNGWSNFKVYCFSEFMEGSFQIYSEIAQLCKEHDIKHVYDIGSCIAFQGKIFTSLGMKYTGVEMETNSIKETTYYDGMEMFMGTYPFSLKVEDTDHTIAVSNLCLGYLLKDGNQGYKQLAKDFRYFCGSIGPDCFDAFQKHFGVLSASQDGTVLWADTQRVYEPNIEALERVDERFRKLFHVSLDLNKRTKDNFKMIKKPNKQIVHEVTKELER